RARESAAKEARALRPAHSRGPERRVYVRRGRSPIVRSLRATIVLKCLGALGLCAGALVIGSAYAKQHPDPRGQLLAQTLAFQFDVEHRTSEPGGPPALGDYRDAAARRYPNEQATMTDGAGRDLPTGEDRSALLAQAWPEAQILHENRGTLVVAIPSADQN